MESNISFTLKVWRQAGPKEKGGFKSYEMKDIPTDTSFLEMLDILNEQLIEKGEEPIVFDHDCREGICGMCSLYINGHPHGPATGATTCQLYMRRFHDGETITVEPWRSAAFPVIKDLMVDRNAFDKIQHAGGYVSFNCGGHFREEYQTPEGEAQRDDENYFYVSCWKYNGSDEVAPTLIKEPLHYEAIKVQTRNYKS